ncbi:DUF1559 domain-containing protein [Armatimonas sp.]|uniref:DUF1559 family PulG-like putative transporter n=1 Tax=Armatimonas sp. TaxID=1872638 RepID=UPI00286D48DE|nr:DUF1559 domain-containing protein [Armatimonas sp.]
MKLSKSAFTLIELLVVIAIIAILAAILFPVFAQARAKARQIACVSNMKQIGVGIMMYSQDYDETYPMSNFRDPAKPDNTTWQFLIDPYVKGGFPEAVSTSANRKLSIYYCPDYDATVNKGTRPSSSYNSNFFVMGSFDANIGVVAERQPPKALAALEAPAQVVAVTESQGNCVWTTGNDTNVFPAPFTSGVFVSCARPYIWARTRHSGGSSFTFADGHAKWFKAPAPSFTGAVATPVAVPTVNGVVYKRSQNPSAGGWFREE